jgi:hypothetical protein
MSRTRKLAALAAAGFLASCSSTGSNGKPQPAAGATCDGWRKLDAGQQTVVIGSVLEQEVGRPRASPLADCMWAISDQITLHIGDLCVSGRSYGDAFKLAFTKAVEFCEQSAK